MNKIYKGYNGTLILGDNTITIKRGAKGFLLGGGYLRGNKSIPYTSITAVQLKKAGIVAGYIQFSIMGGREAKSGLLQSTTDENTINFHSTKNKKFAEAKRIIEERISSLNQSNESKNSESDELEKFSKLRDKGIITEDEFQEKKKLLLGL